MAGDKKLSERDLSPDQLEVYQAMLSWAEGGRSGLTRLARESTGASILTVGGYAGTGKTTLLSVFAKSTKLLVAYVSYTGRASSILRRKLSAAGVKTTTLLRRSDEDAETGGDGFYDDNLGEASGPPLCSTIHRLLYRPVIDPKTEELRGWVKRNKLDRRYDLVVVDEASMVGDDILEDIKSHGVPVMAVGDHGQLPPVRSSGDLMKRPNLRLEKIHRQAEGNPIIALSRHIREGGYLSDFEETNTNAVRFMSKSSIGSLLAKAYAEASSPLDVGVLCWTNKMRVRLNAIARGAAGRKGPPKKGEPVICLKNRPPAYNGMRGVLTEDATVDDPKGPSPWILFATIEFPEDGITPVNYELCAPQFMRETTFASVEELNQRGIPIHAMSAAGDFYDFGYAMTVHKSQGSQFANGFVFFDRPERPQEEDYRRWAYTAVTRASERLTVVR